MSQVSDWKIYALLIVLCCFALVPIFAGNFYATGDMRDVTIPLEQFFHVEELSKRLPAWNPNAAFGFPVIAAAQIGFFYPPLLLLRVLPLYIYLPIIIIGHSVALCIGTFLFLRRLKLSSLASFFGAISFTFSSFVWQHLTHLNIFMSIAWLPWQFLLAHSLIQKKRWQYSDIAILACILGIPFLIGQLQIQTFSTIVIFVFILTERWVQKKSSVIFSLLVVGIVMFGLAAAQLLPTYELAKFSSRGKQGSFDIQTANQYSWPLFHAPTIIWPRFFGHDDTYWGKHLEIEYGISIGTIPVIMALASFIRKKAWKDPSVRFFAWVTVASFLLALGVISPFRLIGIEPTLWIFSSPARWLLFSSFGLSVLAAFGFEHMKEIVNKRFLWLCVAWILFSALVWNLIIFICINSNSISFFATHYVKTEHMQFVIQKLNSLLQSTRLYSVSFASVWTYLPLLALIVTARMFDSKKIHFIVAAVTAFELIIIASTTNATLPWKNLLLPPATVSFLPDSVKHGQARLYSIREGGDTGHYFTDPESRANAQVRENQKKLLVPLLNSQFSIPGVEWPASLDIQAVSNALSEMRGNNGYTIQNTSAAENLNIGAVMIPERLVANIPGGKIHTLEGVAIYQLPFEPRAQFISNATHKAENIAEYRQISPSETSITVEAKEAGNVIVRDTWYPGWKATVDGEEVAITKMLPFFRAIPVGPGKHAISLVYVPILIYWGAGISLMTFFVCCAMLVGRRRNNKNEL